MTTPDYTEWLIEAERLILRFGCAASEGEHAIPEEVALLAHLRRPPVAGVRMLTREEMHATILAAGPLSAGEFKGLEHVQMTYARFNEAGEAIQRKTFEVNGLVLHEGGGGNDGPGGEVDPFLQTR